MKEFSNLHKIEEAVESFLQDLQIGAIGDVGSGYGSNEIKDNYYTIDRDGSLSIIDGRLSLKPPKENGNWPIIKPCENISIMLNGREIKEAIIVKDTDRIEIRAKDRPAESRFYIHLSPDSTEAILETEFVQGESFYIRDEEDEYELTVEAVHLKNIQAPPIDEELVNKKLREKGIKVEIDKEAIASACRSLTNSRTVVARGRKMVPAIDGRVEYLFDNRERIYKEKGENDDLDFFYKGDINSVEAGKALAILIPPIAGVAGLTVKGDIIPAPEGRVAQIRVGEGARLVNGGSMAVATINGRPTTRGKSQKIIHVVPELVIRGDVNIETGHINFKGDIRILGNVREGLDVRATGKIYINGSIFHGRVFGGNGVYVNKNLVGGIICAGGEGAEYKSMLPLLEDLKNGLQGVEDAFRQLKNNEKFSIDDLELRGHGYFIKLIMEMRFPHIIKSLKKLYRMLPQDENKKKEGIWPVIELMYSKLSGLGPLQIKHIDEITKYRDFLGQIIDYIGDDVDEPAHVSVSYCQNALIKATGNISIGRLGSYHSKIHGGGEIDIKGFCRGGEICGGTKIRAKTLGSEMSVPTLVVVAANGEIKADEAYPNVSLGIGGYKLKNTEFKKYVHLVLRDGNIEELL